MHKFVYSLFVFLMLSIQPAISMGFPEEMEVSSGGNIIKAQKTKEDPSLDINALDKEGKSIALKIKELHEQLEEKISELLAVSQDALETQDALEQHLKQHQKQLRGFYEELYESGNFHFVRIWQIDSAYLVGLDKEAERNLYLKNQTAYKEKFGKPYVYSEFWEKKVFKETAWNADGYFASYIEDLIEDEEQWGKIAESLQDPFISFELAKTLMLMSESWDKIPNHPRARDRTLYWYNKYKTYSPSLSMGELEIKFPSNQNRMQEYEPGFVRTISAAYPL